MSINWDYVKERVRRYNENPTDDLLYRIGSHADLLYPSDIADIDRRNGCLSPEQRCLILNWIVTSSLKIKGDLALLIFGREQLEEWLEQSRQAYPDFEFYLAFEFLSQEDTGWESGIYYSLFWSPHPGAPEPDVERDFPWKLDWNTGDYFWGPPLDGCTNDFEFTLSVYPNQESFATKDSFCTEGDRYTTPTNQEAELMSVAEMLEATKVPA